MPEPLHGGLKRRPAIAAFLEDIHAECNTAPRLSLDPLVIVKKYASDEDRELAALVCSTLAFGTVKAIMRACQAALAPLGPRPASRLSGMGAARIRAAYSDFQYRFCFPSDMAAILLAARRARDEAGSLGAFFARGDPGGPDVAAAAAAFVRGLRRLGAEIGDIRPNLLPDPARGSACKRLFLMLRWLVRRDAVDPGGWDYVGASRLIVPLDTHMIRVCGSRLGFLSSTSSSLANALKATAAFRLYSPDDPVKYDFALTRPGIDPRPGDERFGCE